MYVVECVEHMRDGREGFARLVGSLEEATEFIEKTANGFAGVNHSFRVFEVGRELPVEVAEKKRKKPAEYEVRREARIQAEKLQ